MKKLAFLIAAGLLIACTDPLPIRQEIEKRIPWDECATYSVGQYCNEIAGQVQLVYKSLRSNNHAHRPSISPDWWIVD